MLKWISVFACLTVLPLNLTEAYAGQTLAAFAKKPLKNWTISSSESINNTGSDLSQVGFNDQAWLPATVPSTVVAARVAAGQFPDPTLAMNMREIPGTEDYPLGENFSLFDMSAANPYKRSWWYRTEFDLAQGQQDFTWLNFDGINYRANIWLNGKLIASERDVAGSYRRFSFDVSKAALIGQRNALAVEIFAPGRNDLAPSFIDWNPTAADKNMGLWQDVSVDQSGPVRIQHPFVTSKLEQPSLQSARLTIRSEVVNASAEVQSGTLTASIADGPTISRPITLMAGEKRSVSFDAKDFPELVINNPKLWWPYQMGPQNLHSLQISFQMGDTLSHRVDTRFGIREVTVDMIDKLWASYKVNGKPLFIRGAGYNSDFLFRFSDAKDENEVKLIKNLGLNTIRIEGKLANDHLFELADREGIMVMAGWECCSAWEYWNDQDHDLKWNAESYRIAEASLESQLLRLRSHPSILAWLYGSDGAPPEDIENLYLKVIKKTGWPVPAHSQASERDPSKLTGPSGFKMTGPYDYVPPSYWYVDKTYGGAYGFNSETGPGAAVPNPESLKKFLPADKLWPPNEVWNYHMGGTQFSNLDKHNEALVGRYGQALNLDDYAMKAQALAYDGERAMFEAYRRNKGKTTGLIAWMLNNGWPSMLWHIYDYYLAAGGGYYGTKLANEAVHIQYSYDDRSIMLVNESPAGVKGLKASVEVYDIQLNKIFDQNRQGLTVTSDRSTLVLTLPELPLTTTYFVRLLLKDANDQVVSRNFYWLSTQEDKLAWEDTDWWGTPVLSHANMQALNSLPAASAVLTAKEELCVEDCVIHVSIQNPGKTLLFMNRLMLTKGIGGDEILPSFWSDNYLSLLPGERRDLTVRFAAVDRGISRIVLVSKAWNSSEQIITF